MRTNTIQWNGGIDGHLLLLDQTRLPAETVYLECRAVDDVWRAIRQLSVRGAPAIGVAAAYGVCLGVQGGRSVDEVCDYLATSRPTAVNLFAALERMRTASRARAPTRSVGRPPNIWPGCCAKPAPSTRKTAKCAIQSPVTAPICSPTCRRAPASLLIATPALVSGSGDGTALAVIFELARRGKQPQVFADETRPLLQGARLTMWELMQRGIDATLICDSAAAQVMREGRIQAVITGADRITVNGDTANKIGTYGVATLARAHNIPFYVAAPATTFDLSLASGNEIPIEQRSAEEITHAFGRQTAPNGAQVYNPAFDVTPAELITAIITDRGVIQPVTSVSLQAHMA